MTKTEDVIMVAFYDRMKQTRTDAGKSQQDIADILQITRQQYQLYESGKRYIPVDLLATFCRYLNVSADYILDLPDNLSRPR